VITVDGRQERFKAPNDQARSLREGLVSAVCAYHDVEDLDALRAATAEDDGEDAAAAEPEAGDGTVSFGEGPAPLGSSRDDEATATGTGTGTAGDAGRSVDVVGGSDDANADDGFGDSGFRSAGVVDEQAVARELAELREEVAAQNERLERQQQTIQQLIEELRQGR
jgi:hypothetical protein